MNAFSRGWLFFLVTVSACLPFVLGLQANLAGIVDWHKPLIGPALLDPTPPRIFDTTKGRRVVAITSRNVLACLDAKSGDLVWRHVLDDSDPVVSYHVDDQSVILLSGSGGSTARHISISTGSVIWERALLPSIRGAHLTVPVHLGTDVAFSDGQTEGEGGSKSVVVLSDGKRVTKLDMISGKQLWSLEAPGVGDTILFKQILVSGPSVHVLALSSAFASTSLKTLSLSLSTSQPLGDLTQIPSIVSNPSQALLAAANSAGAARVVWTEHGRIRSVYLSEQGALGGTKDLMPGKGHKYEEMIDVGARSRGYILGKKENGAVQIINVKEGGKIVDEFEQSHNSGDKSDSLYTASYLKDAITFNRIYWSFVMELGVAQTYTISGNDDLIATAFTFPFDTTQHGTFRSVGVSPTVSAQQMPQILITTTTDAALLVEQETTRWVREESLADLVAVKFVTLGEPEVQHIGHLLGEENFSQRVLRHLMSLRDLPGYLRRFVSRFTSSSYTSTLAVTPLNSTNLHRDQFGLQKLLIGVTTAGKVFAMDSSSGQSLWSVNLGLFDRQGSDLEVKDMWVTREVGEDGNPSVAILATKTTGKDKSTVGYHIDAYTGEVTGDVDETTGLPKGKTLFHGVMQTAFLTPFENCCTKNRVLGVVDQASKVHLFPSCKKVSGEIAKMAPPMSFTTLSETLGSRSLIGHQISSQADSSFSSSPQWTYTFPVGEVLQSVDPVQFGAISSFGRILGDKSTIYKYLNPHMVVVASTNPTKGTAGVTLLDSLTGRTIYSAAMENVDGPKGVKATMSENWLVFAWLEKGSGWRITSVELYEDTEPKSQGNTPGVSSYGPVKDLKVLSKTFLAPSGIKTMAITSSKFGITAKEVVFVNEKGQVGHLPRRMLDPRRPIGKPSSSDKEEMLIPYEPMIGPDPRRIVSHKYDVQGVKTLTSSPAMVESTSLLFAHGLDLFMTRGLNPSGTFDVLSDTFNKSQLLLTLAVLSIGIAIARPAVGKKALKAKWY